MVTFTTFLMALQRSLCCVVSLIILILFNPLTFTKITTLCLKNIILQSQARKEAWTLISKCQGEFGKAGQLTRARQRMASEAVPPGRPQSSSSTAWRDSVLKNGDAIQCARHPSEIDGQGRQAVDYDDVGGGQAATNLIRCVRRHVYHYIYRPASHLGHNRMK